MSSTNFLLVLECHNPYLIIGQRIKKKTYTAGTHVA